MIHLGVRNNKENFFMRKNYMQLIVNLISDYCCLEKETIKNA